MGLSLLVWRANPDPPCSHTTKGPRGGLQVKENGGGKGHGSQLVLWGA